MAQQFSELKIGDRFYYENFFSPTSSFSLPQLNEIRKMTVERLICDNLADITQVPRNAFFVPDTNKNPMIDCSDVAIVDYSVFNTSSYNL